MSEKRIGTLIYDPSMGRYDIRFGMGDCIVETALM
jgi:hypothetical protein